MLGSGQETPYDLRFQFLGIPVRIQPWFWVVMAFLGGAGHRHIDLKSVLIFVICGLVSVLVHEFGHGLSARAFGYPAAIVLYGMGGICYSQGERQTGLQRLIVVACGPLAGLMLAGLTFLVTAGLMAEGIAPGPVGAEFIKDLLFINIVWSILNLLPVWPLDGGQILAVLLKFVNPSQGQSWAHGFSLFAAGVIALLAYSWLGDLFLALFFGLMAGANYQILRILQMQHRYGMYGDEGPWR